MFTANRDLARTYTRRKRKEVYDWIEEKTLALMENEHYEDDTAWRIALDFNFSDQTREEVQAYIDNLPSWEELLKQDKILAGDGTVLYEREGERRGGWGFEGLHGLATM